MKRVSVIMPAYQSAAVIGDALRSVLAQTYDDWELIVADDASEDDTADVAAAVSSRVRVVRAQVNRGPAAARNLALRQASGELVAFLDADDWWTPHYLERQVGRYDAAIDEPGPPVGLVACDAQVWTEDGGYAARTYYGQFRKVEPVTVERLLR